MTTTDIKKLVLYFAIAAVGLTLWKDWQAEHPTQMVTPSKATQSIPQTPSTPGFPTTPSVTNQSQTTTPAAPLIHVETDRLKLTINPVGGTIVKAGLLDYPIDAKHHQTPYPLLDQSNEKVYLAESGITGLNHNQPLTFTSAQTHYQLASDKNQLHVDVTWSNQQGITVHRQFIFSKNSYLIEVMQSIENTGSTPVTIQPFNQLSRTQPAKQTGFLHSMTTFTGAAFSTPDKPYKKVSFSDLGQQKVNQQVQGGWIAMEQQYFLSAWIPDPNTVKHFYSLQKHDALYTIGMLGQKQKLAPQQTLRSSNKLYLGPELVDQLKLAAPNLQLTIDYGWLWFISIGILWMLTHFHQLLGNWGMAIILVTAVIKLIFYPLSASSYRSMARMRKLQPRIQALKERCGEDKQKFSQSMMELYKNEKVNPFGGCLPILVQIPVFIALYWVLLESVQLRQAPFILWWHDLAAPDPYFVLPIIMGVTMFIQQKISPAPPDPTQAKVMMFLPVIFTVFFLNFPSGLVLYWIVNNSLSILQQWSIMKKLGN